MPKLKKTSEKMQDTAVNAGIAAAAALRAAISPQGDFSADIAAIDAAVTAAQSLHNAASEIEDEAEMLARALALSLQNEQEIIRQNTEVKSVSKQQAIEFIHKKTASLHENPSMNQLKELIQSLSYYLDDYFHKNQHHGDKKNTLAPLLINLEYYISDLNGTEIPLNTPSLKIKKLAENQDKIRIVQTFIQELRAFQTGLIDNLRNRPRM